jgi:hypothetical protein
VFLDDRLVLGEVDKKVLSRLVSVAQAKKWRGSYGLCSCVEKPIACRQQPQVAQLKPKEPHQQFHR